MAQYFVKQNASGTGDGLSLVNAWSLATFNGSVIPVGGDTVFFSGTFTSTVIPSCNGISSARIILDFTAATLTTATPRVNFNGRSFLTFNGGTISPNGSSGNIFDFNNIQAHDITINGWTYTGPAGGLELFLWSDYCFNLTVSNNTVDNVSGLWNGDTILTHDVLILNNFARTSVNTATQTDVIRVGDASNVTIQGNKLINQAPGASAGNHNDCIQCYIKGGGNAGNPHNWIVRYNWVEILQNSGSGDNSWTIFQNLDLNPAMKVYGNVFVGTGSVGNNGLTFSFGTAAGVYYVHNNTFIRHNSPDHTVEFLSPGTANYKNNVMQSGTTTNGSQWFVNTMTVGAFDHNFFYLSDGSAGAGTGGSTALNPLFTNVAGNDFSTQASSPLRNAGDPSIGPEYNQGIAFGATWPNPTLVTRSLGAWDIGAFQNSSGGPITATLAILSKANTSVYRAANVHDATLVI